MGRSRGGHRGGCARPGHTRAGDGLGVEVVYYLVHSIGNGGDFARSDRVAAAQHRRRGSRAGVGRIVYLGGLVPEGEEASPHLASRAEVGQCFLDGPVPAVVLQAGVIIGSGSASFEMLRYLTERLPVMVTPTWVRSLVQPIAVRDVLTYLERCLDSAGRHRSSVRHRRPRRRVLSRDDAALRARRRAEAT